ncbi:MAG: DUF3300 domain-containing protein [Gammaproteobacteria bacterium]|nr:DUF3300 domain-containing protein [Gammaproteobacteria bacterium]
MAFRERLISLIFVAALGATMPLSSTAEGPSTFSDAEIESLLAPVALYPDTLLTQILIAATYPLDVVEAARFIAEHPELKGSDAVLAAAAFDWDPSVQALTAFPEVLARMDADLRWTRDLGEAFLAQQEDVMLSLQTLRQRARLAGTLEDSEHLQLEQRGERLVLQPPREDLVYVPWYDTTSAYGEWPSQQHQPVYWDPNPRYQSGFHSTRLSRSSLFWSQGIHLDPLYYPTRLDWHPRGVIIVERSHGRPWRHGSNKDRRDGRRQDDRRQDYANRVRDDSGARGDWRQRRDHRGAERHWDHDRRDQRAARSWPDEPTASLSQQRAGAIDTRSASERLRALQAEAAAAHEQSARQQQNLPARRFAGQPSSRQDRSAEQHSQGRDMATTMIRQQREIRTRNEPSRNIRRQESPGHAAAPRGGSQERSRPNHDRQQATTRRSFGGASPQPPQQTRSGAHSQRSAPTTRQFGRPGSPPRIPD